MVWLLCCNKSDGSVRAHFKGEESVSPYDSTLMIKLANAAGEGSSLLSDMLKHVEDRWIRVFR
jgi:hypothetical protein